jgi:hypothetical protein
LREKGGLNRINLADRIDCRKYNILFIWEERKTKNPLSICKRVLVNFYIEMLLEG